MKTKNKSGWISLQKEDPEIYDAIGQEVKRQRNKLELIASENYVSRAVLEATGSILTNKYAEGYPGRRYYGGCEYVDCVEELARERAKQLFGAEHANVQPHSGSQANMIPYDPQPAKVTSGIRVGTPALTSRGFGLAEMEAVGKLIGQVLRSPDDEADLTGVRDEVQELAGAFPVPGIHFHEE